MNSLENLNNWANDDIPYNGNATYSITFDPTSPVNQTTSIVEDVAFVSPVGTNITSMVNTPRDIYYTIDLSSVALPATIEWGTLPYFISNEVAGFNIFRLVGPIDENIWAQAKSPIITILDQATTFTYTATITYPDPSNTVNDLTKSWTVTASVTAVPNISTPTAFEYTKNNTGTIAGSPTILNTAAGTYGLVLTPSQPTYVYTFASSGSGGTSVFDPVYKTLTLGGTKTQVNSHLASIQFTPVTDENRSFVLSYQLTNPSGVQNTVTQNLTSTDPFVINTATYVEDVPFALNYVIKDASATATSFTISVAQTTPLPAVSPGFFTVNGSNVGNTWTASNTRANINAANVIFTPPVDYTGTITMTVNQSKVDNGFNVVQIVNQPVNILNAGTNPEITNMINRSFTANTVNNIFATQTPAINDGADTGQTYTITLTSAQGKFGNSAANAIASASYSFTGNMSATNSEFTNMVFVPNKNAALSGSFTYTQARGATAQANLSPSLSGTASPVPGAAIYSYTANSTFTPTFAQAYWGNCRVLTVGGGGGGASGGGGGAGGVVRDQFINLQEATYNVVVGAGGAVATPPGSGTFTVTGTAGGSSYLSLGGTVFCNATGGGGGRNTNTAPYDRFGGSNDDFAGGGPANSVRTGGGAGAGGAGTVFFSGTAGGTGGIARSTNIRGFNEWFAGGGGGNVTGYPWGGNFGTSPQGSFGGAGTTTGSYTPAANEAGGGGGGGPGGNGFRGLVVIKIS